MTNDVENFSLSSNSEDPQVAKQIYNEALPKLLSVLSKNDIKSTFYFTGTFCEESPESVELVMEHGHDIGCHGYDHSNIHAFDSMNLEDQIADLNKVKYMIEKIAGRIWDFRAPALRINEDTIKALEKTGFNTDSSIASQRFDGPFTSGSKKKLRWMTAPRHPYFLSYSSIVRNGASNILEIPITAFILSYIGTTMRVSPTTLRILEKFFFAESIMTEKPIVFLFHPNECLNLRSGIKPKKRGNNFINQIFADYMRNKLKKRNLGQKAADLLDDVIQRAKRAGFEFVTVQEYRKIIR
ncbi:MAG: polysaccharide deacetylase family protein [Candidatus Methanoperedenaceae archaeon]|nr:polysaccharide deacetylase family protein [Candidatus Methanoperedenaceae archaeon]